MKGKFGFWSIVLLGINAIIGSGIFLLPNKAYSIIGPKSMLVILFDALLVASLALCFAEASGYFKKNGGPYIYAKEAFGEFVGFEVGFMKWAISIIAWAAMAAAFAQALGNIWAPAQETVTKNIIITIVLVGLGFLNYLGVNISKVLNNIITIGKLLPLLMFCSVGIFFINGGNFQATAEVAAKAAEPGAFAAAAILIFYAFTGFESIAVAAEDMENPEKNIPKAIIVVIGIVSIFYLIIMGVSIGTLGDKLALSSAPIADATGMFLGSIGASIVAAGTIISIGGINIAASFITPRSGVALAEDGLLPRVIAKQSKHGTPGYAILITVVLALFLSWSGSFSTLAAISVISRFAQYLPTCVAILVLRKRKDLTTTFEVPFGPVIPIVAVSVSLWMLSKASLYKILFGLGGLAVGIPIYFIMKKVEQNNKLAQ